MIYMALRILEKLHKIRIIRITNLYLKDISILWNDFSVASKIPNIPFKPSAIDYGISVHIPKLYLHMSQKLHNIL